MSSDPQFYLEDRDNVRYYLLRWRLPPTRTVVDQEYSHEFILSADQRDAIMKLHEIVRSPNGGPVSKSEYYEAIGFAVEYQQVKDEMPNWSTDDWIAWYEISSPKAVAYERQQLKRILNPNQIQRLTQILNRQEFLLYSREGDRIGITAPDAVKLLGISDKQLKNIADTFNSSEESIQKAKEELQQKLDKIARRQRILVWNELNKDQKDRFEKLTGERLSDMPD